MTYVWVLRQQQLNVLLQLNPISTDIQLDRLEPVLRELIQAILAPPCRNHLRLVGKVLNFIGQSTPDASRSPGNQNTFAEVNSRHVDDLAGLEIS